MAAARHNRPTIIVYGGTISPGVRQVDCPGMGFKKGGMVNIGDAFESYGWFLHMFIFISVPTVQYTPSGAFLTGKITEEERVDVVRHSCPGAGACGGMYTQVSFRST
jgi:dihydroxy-acid dehydratase